MSPTLARSSLRYAWRHPWQLGLALLGIALGVAVVVAIDLANASARHAFDLSRQAVFGRTTHEILGGPAGLPQAVYARLRVEGIVEQAAPVVVGHLTFASEPGRSLELFGVDPFAEGEFRPWLGDLAQAGAGRSRHESAALGELLTRPGSVLVSASLARAAHLTPGERIPIEVGGRRREVTLIGLIEPRNALSRTALSDLVVTDISTAQDLLAIQGRLSRIDLILPAGARGRGMRARIRAELPPGASVVSAGSRSRAAAQMTAAFELNLFMLSLLALVVGIFLIYNTMTFSVIQRRALIGSLRALGVTRREILVLILAEAALLAVLGTLAGLGLGVGLAELLVGMVARTISDLYFSVSVSQVYVAPGVLWLGAALGLGAVLAAALVPALEATRVPPRAALARSEIEARARRLVPRAALAAVLVLAASGALLGVPGGGLAAAFAALFGMIAGFTLLAPLAVVVLVWVLRPFASALGGSLGALSVRGVAASLSRTAVAIAALAVALSATVGVGLMVDSFRQSVVSWLHTTLRADIYVSVPGAGVPVPLDSDLIARLRAVRGVSAVSLGRSVRVQSPAGSVEVIALRPAPQSHAGFRFLEGEPADIWPAFAHAGAVIVSGPYSYHHDVHRGGTVRLRTEQGMHAFPVAGVFQDYGSEQGVVMMSHATFERYWHAPGYTSVGVYAAPGVDLHTLIARLQAAAGGEQALRIRSNRAIRQASLQIFDRTFTITLVLRLLATVVAFVGVLSALMALQLERGREVAVLRACGLTQGQVWGLVGAQSGVMGLIAGLLALPLGLVLALLLIVVINHRSFGWTLGVHLAPGIFVEALVLACAAALLAGLYPAYRMARTPPGLAMREDQ